MVQRRQRERSLFEVLLPHGRISVLKPRHGLHRCRYHGVDGMHRWVGFGVIADNLMNIATFTRARAIA